MRPILTPGSRLTPESSPEPQGPAASLQVSADLRLSLLELARVALAVATGVAPPSALDRALARSPGGDTRGGTFVTLTVDGELRGCMGNLAPELPLREGVVNAALSAALDDPRFLPVTADELPGLRIDVSVLGSPVRATDRDAFQPGIDGVIVECGRRTGLLLPEVATEFSWGAIEMFDAVCRKAGLPRDAWRDPGTRLRFFRTARFGGPAMTTH